MWWFCRGRGVVFQRPRQCFSGMRPAVFGRVVRWKRDGAARFSRMARPGFRGHRALETGTRYPAVPAGSLLPRACRASRLRLSGSFLAPPLGRRKGRVRIVYTIRIACFPEYGCIHSAIYGTMNTAIDSCIDACIHSCIHIAMHSCIYAYIYATMYACLGGWRGWCRAGCVRVRRALSRWAAWPWGAVRAHRAVRRCACAAVA